MRKPENTFIGSVHKHLPTKLHREKMNNPYRGGTADCWYSGMKGDLWIEFKYLERVPVTADVKVDLSALQVLWLRGRYGEGRNVAVIVGCKEGGVVLRDLTWENNMSTLEYKTMIQTRENIASWILSETGEPNDQERSRNLSGAGGVAQKSGRHAPDMRGPVRRSASKRAI